jgi:lipoyl synthase
MNKQPDDLCRAEGLSHLSGTGPQPSLRWKGGRHFPEWLKRPVAFSGRKAFVEESLSRAGLHTVCSAAKCPNRGECHARGAATFLIMGEICTRHCGFCNVDHGAPGEVDPGEPLRLSEAAFRMGLRHVVVTSVTRDDMPDGGASMFARTVRALRRRIPGVIVELLVPDFNGNEAALVTVLESGPDILCHNMETVPRLYPAVRPGASYKRSIELLAKTARRGESFMTKSGIMVGLGETVREVEDTMSDLKNAGCAMLTIGQYLRPSGRQIPVVDFIHPSRFQRFEETGRAMGFFKVFAGPFVRSSYRAGEMAGNSA